MTTERALAIFCIDGVDAIQVPIFLPVAVFDTLSESGSKLNRILYGFDGVPRIVLHAVQA